MSLIKVFRFSISIIQANLRRTIDKVDYKVV